MCLGCEKKNSKEHLEGGELMFSDDFEREDIGESWSAEGDAWEIEEGVLRVSGARNDALWLQEELPEKVRVEFKARAYSAEGDLKFEIFGDGETHESGYIGIFGGWDNRLNIIARQDEHGDDRKEGAEGKRVQQNKWYDFTIVRSDSTIHWYVDGEPFMTYRDAAPLEGEGHKHFGFNDWEAPIGFDDVAIYDLGSSDE
jgi:hypothetical protein